MTSGATAGNDSGDEYYDAADSVLAVDHLCLDHLCLSPSISVSALEGDPPEIEEDKDHNDGDNDGNV